ncbi:hypothetical protein SNE40_023775, partial [Patella caerulea]
MADVAAPAPATKSPKKKMASKPKAAATHPKYVDMIRAAIGSLKERGGSSRQAILKYVMANYKVGSDLNMANSRVKTALKNGVKSGVIKQSKGTGAAGSFKLGDVKAEKPKVKKAAKKSPAKKTAAAKKPKAKKAAPKKAATPKKAKATGAKKTVKPKKAKSP